MLGQVPAPGAGPGAGPGKRASRVRSRGAGTSWKPALYPGPRRDYRRPAGRSGGGRQELGRGRQRCSRRGARCAQEQGAPPAAALPARGCGEQCQRKAEDPSRPRQPPPSPPEGQRLSPPGRGVCLSPFLSKAEASFVFPCAALSALPLSASCTLSGATFSRRLLDRWPPATPSRACAGCEGASEATAFAFELNPVCSLCSAAPVGSAATNSGMSQKETAGAGNTHADTSAHTCDRTQTRVHTHADTLHTHASTHKHSVCMCAREHTTMHVHRHVCTHAHASTHTQAQMHILVSTHLHTCARTHTLCPQGLPTAG